MTDITRINAGRSDNRKFLNILTATTTLVKSGPGRLVRIVNNKKVANGVITIYDSLTATGTKVGTITNPATLLESAGGFEYDCDFGTGLCIVTSSTDDITVVYE